MTPKLKTGDVFSFAISPNELIFGRVMLDVDVQCIKPKRILASSPLTFFKGAQLIEVSRDRDGADVLISGVFTFPPTWERVASRPVDPCRVDFPWTMSLKGPRPHLYWGEVALPVQLPIPEYRQLEVSPSVSPANALVPLSLYRLGRARDIDKSKYKDIELFNPGRNDLRLSNHRTRVQQLVGGRAHGDYYSTALAYGLDLCRFYVGGRVVLLCPYCYSILQNGAAKCTGCEQPTGRDALVEMTLDELATKDRKQCKACSAPILRSVVICHWCKTRQ